MPASAAANMAGPYFLAAVTVLSIAFLTSAPVYVPLSDIGSC